MAYPDGAGGVLVFAARKSTCQGHPSKSDLTGLPAERLYVDFTITLEFAALACAIVRLFLRAARSAAWSRARKLSRENLVEDLPHDLRQDRLVENPIDVELPVQNRGSRIQI